MGPSYRPEGREPGAPAFSLTPFPERWERVGHPAWYYFAFGGGLHVEPDWQVTITLGSAMMQLYPPPQYATVYSEQVLAPWIAAF